MSSTELIDTAVRVYQQIGWLFLKQTVVPAIFVVTAFAFIERFIVPAFFVTKNASSLSVQFTEVAFAIGLTLLVGGPLFIIGVSATTALVTQMVSDYMLGRTPSAEAAYKAAKRTIGTLLRVHIREMFFSCGGLILAVALSALSSTLDQVTSSENVVAGLVALVAFFGFAAGGFLFLLIVSRHALAPPIAVLENLKPKQAAKRSAELLRSFGAIPGGYGNVWSLYVVLFLLSILVSGGLNGMLALIGFPNRFETYFDNIPYGGLFIEALRLVPLFLWVWTIIPVWATTITLIYFDRRIRLEGYDIEALAADVWRTDRQNRFEL